MIKQIKKDSSERLSTIIFFEALKTLLQRVIILLQYHFMHMYNGYLYYS